jgi:anti-sigma regulatory factor (Ser/Thr protein kinase)
MGAGIMPEPHTRELKMIAGPDVATQALDFVADACQAWGVGDAARFDILLAVDEAVSNIVNHGYPAAGGPITLRIWRQARAIHIELVDRGIAFDPATAAAPKLSGPLAQRAIGGLGLYLMRQVMDDVRYEHGTRGNVLQLIKQEAVA